MRDPFIWVHIRCPRFLHTLIWSGILSNPLCVDKMKKYTIPNRIKGTRSGGNLIGANVQQIKIMRQGSEALSSERQDLYKS